MGVGIPPVLPKAMDEALQSNKQTRSAGTRGDNETVGEDISSKLGDIFVKKKRFNS